MQIPYEGTTLPGYFYKVDDSGKPRPTLIFLGGYDSSVEELFYSGAAAAIRRGYNCLTFDGPGQGAPLREQGLYHRYDWEAVVAPVVDYILTRPDVDADNLALMGMSQGGYFAARAVAFEHRIQAAIFYDGVYENAPGILAMMPKEAVAALDAGNPIACGEITQKAMHTDTNMRWLVNNGIWSFGASSLADFIAKAKQYTMEGIAGQIRCPSLVLDGEGDMFALKEPQKIYDALQCPKQLFQFTKESGAENHCQTGALAYKDEVVFNWLDETLKLHDARKLSATAKH